MKNQRKSKTMLKPLPAIHGVANKIYEVRGFRVMLDHDIADLYQMQTKALLQALKRNPERFPPDFAFLMTKSELETLRSQIVTSNSAMKMGLRRPPYAFTEQGVAMLSSVLRSPRAVEVNITIMRAFVSMREAMLSHKDLAERLTAMEQKYDAKFKIVFDALRELMSPPPISAKLPIGFIPPSEKRMMKSQHKR